MAPHRKFIREASFTRIEKHRKKEVISRKCIFRTYSTGTITGGILFVQRYLGICTARQFIRECVQTRIQKIESQNRLQSTCCFSTWYSRERWSYPYINNINSIEKHFERTNFPSSENRLTNFKNYINDILCVIILNYMTSS